MTQTDNLPFSDGDVREAVASFASKAAARRAVDALIKAGFEPADLSVLATHESLEVLGRVPGYRASPDSSLAASLSDEAVYLTPLTIATISLLSGGPMAAGLALVAEAGLGIGVVKEAFDRIAANRSGPDMLKAIKEGGLLLWVRVTAADREATALRILAEAEGGSVHVAEAGG